MKPNEQKDFVDSLVGIIVAGMLADIEDGNVPARWHGMELRQWVTERVAEGCGGDLTDGRIYATREYRNDRLINNI